MGANVTGRRHRCLMAAGVPAAVAALGVVGALTMGAGRSGPTDAAADGYLMRRTLAGPVEVDRTDATLSLVNGVLYRNGAPFTGQVRARYHDYTPKSVTPYVDGRREGTAIRYFPSGQLQWTRTYLAGLESGVHSGWYDDGRIHFRYPYSAGVLKGNALEWYPDGTLYRDFNYAAGREEGGQRMWHEDGSLRANYVVRNGRRYGLMGAKGCAGDSTLAGEGD